MQEVEFRDKFVAYLDVLGFKTFVEAAEAGASTNLNEARAVLKEYGSTERWSRRGMYCPESRYVQRDRDFRVLQVSDCIVASSEISPAGVINLVSYCSVVVFCLMNRGFMCRGYLTRGLVFHTDSDVVGSGYQRALENEKNVVAFRLEADERGTPFVEVDKIVCDYVRQCGDECVKEMFSRFVKSDGESVAIFPFQSLAHSFIVAGRGIRFDADRERQSNENVRAIVEIVKTRIMASVDMSNPSVAKKTSYYLQALDAQLAVCDRTEEMITLLGEGGLGQGI